MQVGTRKQDKEKEGRAGYCHFCGSYGTTHSTSWGTMCDACHKKINEIQGRRNYCGAGIG